MITDKNKEQFEKWFSKTFTKVYIKLFYDAPFEMKIGMYLAYYDSLDIMIFTYNRVYGWECLIKGLAPYNYYDTRNEAYKEAFIRANEIVNNDF